VPVKREPFASGTSGFQHSWRDVVGDDRYKPGEKYTEKHLHPTEPAHLLSREQSTAALWAFTNNIGGFVTTSVAGAQFFHV